MISTDHESLSKSVCFQFYRSAQHAHAHPHTSTCTLIRTQWSDAQQSFPGKLMQVFRVFPLGTAHGNKSTMWKRYEKRMRSVPKFLIELTNYIWIWQFQNAFTHVTRPGVIKASLHLQLAKYIKQSSYFNVLFAVIHENYTKIFTRTSWIRNAPNNQTD